MRNDALQRKISQLNKLAEFDSTVIDVEIKNRNNQVFHNSLEKISTIAKTEVDVKYDFLSNIKKNKIFFFLS